MGPVISSQVFGCDRVQFPPFYPLQGLHPMEKMHEIMLHATPKKNTVACCCEEIRLGADQFRTPSTRIPLDGFDQSERGND